MTILFEHLNTNLHDRVGFSCIDDDLTTFFKQNARQEQERGDSVIYVAVEENNRKVVLGYYTLSARSFRRTDLPNEAQRPFRYALISTILIGRLARDQNHSTPGFGKQLLADALKKIQIIASQLGARCVEVNAKNEKVCDLYFGFGFRRLNDDPNHLYLPIYEIPQVLKANSLE